jgi:hypothetical protein
MRAIVSLRGEEVEVFYTGEAYTPANFGGHPDNWTPAEGGEIEIAAVEYETCGRAWIDGKWVKCDRVVADVAALLSPDDLMSVEDKIFEIAKQPQEVEP